MKILYFYCGEGLGHATRTISAGTKLAKDNEVIFASYGYARDFLLNNGLNIRETPSEIRMAGSSGALDINQSILKTLKETNPSSVLAFNKLIKEVNPELVISDSFFLPALVAKTKNIPCWMILNQTNIDKFFADRERHIRWIGNAIKKFNYNTLERMDKIIIPDFAPPFTICEKNLDITPKLYEKTEFIGPLIRKNSNEVSKPKEKIDIYCSIGGFGYRAQLLDKIIDVAKNMKNKQFHLVAGPNAKKSGKIKNIKFHETIKNPLDMMAKAAVIIAGGGHSTIMESACLGKPVISVPDQFHFEQEQNALKLETLGIGSKISYKTPPEIIEELIINHSKSKEIKSKTDVFRKLAVKIDGRKNLAKLVKEK